MNIDVWVFVFLLIAVVSFATAITDGNPIAAVAAFISIGVCVVLLFKELRS